MTVLDQLHGHLAIHLNGPRCRPRCHREGDRQRPWSPEPVAQEYRMLCDWLKGRSHLHEDLHVAFPDGQGFAAFKQLLQPFIDAGLPESKLNQSIRNITDL